MDFKWLDETKLSWTLSWPQRARILSGIALRFFSLSANWFYFKLLKRFELYLTGRRNLMLTCVFVCPPLMPVRFSETQKGGMMYTRVSMVPVGHFVLNTAE